MESQPQNPESRINPENFHPCIFTVLSFPDKRVLLIFLAMFQKIVSRESKPRNSRLCQRGNTKCMEHILSKSRSSRPIRTPLKSINHASKYCIYERFHYFGAHFTKIGSFAMKKMLKTS